MRKHSVFAPSAAYRWKNCAGSVRLSKTAPPQLETKYAIEGTKAHECLEYIVRRWGSLKRAKEEALKKWQDEDMVRYAVESAEIIFSLRPSKSATLFIEERVKLPHITKELYGSLDYAWVDDWGTLVVIDYKYGAGIQVLPIDQASKEENPQLMIYAAGMAHKFDYEFDKAQLAIVQPRTCRNGESPLTAGFTTIKRIRDFEKDLTKAIALAKTPDAPLNAGEWCRFCPAITTCPEVSRNQMVKADIVFDVDRGVEAVPDPKGLTPDTLSKILDACDVLEDWISAVRARAFHLAEAGKKIPGRKLVQKRASRVWLAQANTAAVELFGDHAFVREMLSPAQLEKSLGKAHVKDFIDKYTTSVSSGFNLVRESDGRLETSAVAFDLDNEK